MIPGSNSPTPGNDEDSLLLSLASELCTLMGISYPVRGVIWLSAFDNLGGGRLYLPSDNVDFVIRGPKLGRVLLPAALKGRLDREEWRPLLASGLAFTFSPPIRKVWRVLQPLLRVCLVFSILALPLLAQLSIGIALHLDLLLSLPIFAAAFVELLVVNNLMRKYYNLHIVGGLHLRADTLSARMNGTARFIRTLQKIDAMKIEDLDDSKLRKRGIIRRRNASPFPTVAERIANLHWAADHGKAPAVTPGITTN